MCVCVLHILITKKGLFNGKTYVLFVCFSVDVCAGNPLVAAASLLRGLVDPAGLLRETCARK